MSEKNVESKQSNAVRPPNTRLGRGLSSLIKNTPAQQEPKPSPAEVGAAGKPMEIPVGAISPNPYQPRREFSKLELEELTESIRQDGVLQPLIVRPDGEEKYTLIAGERRLRASKAAGLKTVPCIIREADDKQMIEWAVIENIQREDLNPIEKAEAYRDYMERFELTQQETARRLGQPRSAVANALRLLDLSDEVQKMVVADQLSFGHAKLLAGLAGRPEVQVKLARKIIAEGVSVRKLEELVKEAAAGIQTNKPAKHRGKPEAKEKPAYVRDIEQQLTETVGTRVTVLPARKKNSGKIIVEYYSLDDFDRISGMLGLDDLD